MKRFLALLIFATLVVARPSLGADEEGWVNLVPHGDLSGWERKGGVATYRVEEGEVVGTSAPNTQNTFLCTKKNYTNFVLEFEYFGHSTLNSGVQVRSNSMKSYKKGRVHGYQIELEEDGRERDWSGGIYDEGRRGWLHPNDADKEGGVKFGEAGRRLWKEGAWNHLRVECKGDRIRTWLNGEPRADLTDDVTPTGFIALQVHGVGRTREPLSIRWRNIRIKELP